MTTIRRQDISFRRRALAALALSFGPPGAALSQGQKPSVKLGLITPLTGPLASYGKAQEMVMKLEEADRGTRTAIAGPNAGGA